MRSEFNPDEGQHVTSKCEYGECHRFPPTLIEGWFPRTDETDYCGEWKRK